MATRAEDAIGFRDRVPLGLEWTRWALASAHPELRFAPAFPDRPLVVKTRSNINLPPGSRVELFVQIPVWVELSACRGDAAVVLAAFPTQILFNTWFGPTSEGQLCYALPSRARRHLDDVELFALRVVCPFQLHNRSADPIPVERIRVFPEHLAIYRGGPRLWTGAVSAYIDGPDKPAPVVIFQSFGDSSINYTLGAWCDRTQFLDLRNSLARDVKRVFDAEGIEVPFPQRVVAYAPAPPGETAAS